MPARTRVDPEFGRAVQDAIGTLSQSEVALRAQISVGYLSRIRRGSVPSREIIVSLAEALHTDPEPLLKSAGYIGISRVSDRESAGPGAGDGVPQAGATANRDLAEIELLGPDAATQYYRQLWDSCVIPLFPDAEMPAGAGLPRTGAAIRQRVKHALRELIDEDQHHN